MYVKVRVAAGAKRERVVRVDEVRFELSVREPAQRNLANTRVREIIAEAFHVPVGKVRLVAGHRSSSKVLDVEAL